MKDKDALKKDKEQKKKRQQVKKLAAALGQKQVANIHLDKYTD